MSAEEIIALETAMRDVARLYETALLFTALRQTAEAELFQRLGQVGSLLRLRLRGDDLGPGAIREAAAEIHALGRTWQARIDAIRTDPAFLAAVAALGADDRAALVRLIPGVFAGLRPATDVGPVLFYPVPLARPRKRPGAPPFLTATEAVAQIVACRGGIEAAAATSDCWWDEALPYLSLADDPTILDSPVALALELNGTRPPAVFASETELTLRLYARRLQAPFSVSVQTEPQDEWWEASGTYAGFREELLAGLEAASISVLAAGRS